MKELTIFYTCQAGKEREGVLQQVEGVEDPHPHPLTEVESLHSLARKVN